MEKCGHHFFRCIFLLPFSLFFFRDSKYRYIESLKRVYILLGLCLFFNPFRSVFHIKVTNVSFCSFLIPTVMVSVTAVTNYHKLSLLKQHKFIILHVCTSQVRHASTRLKMAAWTHEPVSPPGYLPSQRL